MRHNDKVLPRLGKQAGVSLIEVMIAVFISAVGLLGAAAMQLNALKYTDSALKTSQASFIAYDILERMRANASPATLSQYDLPSVSEAPAHANNHRQHDLMDFAKNVKSLDDTGTGVIDVHPTKNATVTITIGWDEGRAAGVDEASGQAHTGVFSITTDLSVQPE